VLGGDMGVNIPGFPNIPPVGEIATYRIPRVINDYSGLRAVNDHLGHQTHPYTSYYPATYGAIDNNIEHIDFSGHFFGSYIRGSTSYTDQVLIAHSRHAISEIQGLGHTNLLTGIQGNNGRAGVFRYQFDIFWRPRDNQYINCDVLFIATPIAAWFTMMLFSITSAMMVVKPSEVITYLSAPYMYRGILSGLDHQPHCICIDINRFMEEQFDGYVEQTGLFPKPSYIDPIFDIAGLAQIGEAVKTG